MSINQLYLIHKRKIANRSKRKQSLNQHLKKKGGIPQNEIDNSVLRRSVSTRKSDLVRRSVSTRKSDLVRRNVSRRSDYDNNQSNKYNLSFLNKYEKADYSKLEHCIDRYPFRDEIRMILKDHAIELINAQVIYQNKLVQTKRILRSFIKAYMIGEEKIMKFIYTNDNESRSDLKATPQSAGNGHICFYSNKDEAYGEQYGSNHDILDRLKQRSTTCITVPIGSKLYVYDDDAVIACTANLEMTYTASFRSALGGKTGFSNRYLMSRRNATSEGFAWVAMPSYRIVKLTDGEETTFDPDYIVMVNFEKKTPLPTIEKMFKFWTSKRGWQKFQGPCTIYLSEATIPIEVESRMNGTPGPRGPQGPKGSSGMLDALANMSIIKNMTT